MVLAEHQIDPRLHIFLPQIRQRADRFPQKKINHRLPKLTQIKIKFKQPNLTQYIFRSACGPAISNLCHV